MYLRTRGVLLLAALALPPAAVRADQEDSCRSVSGPISTFFYLDATCLTLSPFGFCTQGTIASGPLQGTTSFHVLTMGPGPIPNSIVYTGALTITTPNGTLNIRDTGILDGNRYFEIDQIVGGTGAYEDAHGLLTSQGLFLGTGFSGTIAGTLCSEAKGRHEGHDKHRS